MGLINVEDRSGVLSLDKGDAGTVSPDWTGDPVETFRQLYFTVADYNNMGKFLNRILGMEVQQQNALFQYFSDTLAAVIQEAKKNGRYDMGILGEWAGVRH